LEEQEPEEGQEFGNEGTQVQLLVPIFDHWEAQTIAEKLVRREKNWDACSVAEDLVLVCQISLDPAPTCGVACGIQ